MKEIINKYECGRLLYINGFDYFNKYTINSITNKIKCLTYYMKYNGYDINKIINYIIPNIIKINKYDRENIYKYIKYSKKTIEKEYNREYQHIKFYKDEVDFINGLSNSSGKVVFFLMCYYKTYGIYWMDISGRRIKTYYNNSIMSGNIDIALSYLLDSGYIDTKQFKNGKISRSILTEKFTSLCNENIVYEFKNTSNINMLFDFITNRYIKKSYGFCEYCGEIFEKKSPNSRQKKCTLCRIDEIRKYDIERKRIK